MCSKLNFKIHSNTLEYAINLKNLLNNISIHRIKSEISTILNGINVKEALMLIKKYEILNINQIPKNIKKVPKELRKYIIIFNDSKLQDIYLKDVFQYIDKVPKTFIKREILLKHLILKFDENKILCAIRIKSKLNIKYRKLKKTFKRNMKKGLKLSINGNDLKKIGIEGKNIKYIKNNIYNLIIAKKANNNKTDLLNLAKYLMENKS